MKGFTDKQKLEFAEEFLDYYLKEGLGNRSKTDIDARIYSILCDVEYIDDSQPAILIGQKYKTTTSTINKYKEIRFFNGKIDKRELKKQVCKIFEDNKTKIINGMIRCSINNLTVKLYLEAMLQDANLDYDYSFNTNNISMDIDTFLYIYKQFDKNEAKLLEKTINSLNVQNSVDKQNVINIYQNNKDDTKTFFQQIRAQMPQLLVTIITTMVACMPTILEGK